jgi:hypothetical protein
MKHSVVKRNPIAPRGPRGKVVRSAEDLRSKAQPDAEGYDEFMKFLRESRRGGKARR